MIFKYSAIYFNQWWRNKTYWYLLLKKGKNIYVDTFSNNFNTEDNVIALNS